MNVLVIIVNYRTPDTTLSAVDAVLRDIEGMHAALTIVDNDSRDGSLEKIQRAVDRNGWSRRVTVMASPRNGGFGFGNNIALRRALASETPPEYFFLLNPDAFPDPGATAFLMAFMDSHPEAGIAGSRIRGLDGTTHTSAFRFPSLLGEVEAGLRLGLASRALNRWKVAPPVPPSSRRVDWVSGASMMVRRVVFETVGLFDEQYFLYFEETDLCRRAGNAGFKTYYVHESTVRHVGSISTGMKDSGRRVPGYWFASRRRYFLKNHGKHYLWAANAAWSSCYALWRVRRRMQNKPDLDPPRYLLDFVRYNIRPEGSGYRDEKPEWGGAR